MAGRPSQHPHDHGAPRDGHTDGPLPALLLILTVVTGLVDAASYLLLGQVFVANMTGNVVFIGFALAGSGVQAGLGSLTSIAAFLVGGAIGGRIATRFHTHRGRMLAGGTAVHAALVVLALIVMWGIRGDGPTDDGTRYGSIVVLAVGMGLQSALANRLKVADLKTTVVTSTLTRFAADSRPAGGTGHNAGRRLASVATMAGGAFLGGLLLRYTDVRLLLILSLVLLIATVVAVAGASRREAPWHHPSASS